MTRDEAMHRHPSAVVIWTPDDFTAAAEQAMALVRDDTAKVYDFTTGEVSSSASSPGSTWRSIGPERKLRPSWGFRQPVSAR